MALTKYPGFGDDATQSDDPLDSLAALLSGQYPSATPTNLGNRNNFAAAAIRKKYGFGPDVGDISQADLEAYDRSAREASVNDIVASTVPQVATKAAGDMAVERARAQNALDVENMKGQYGLKGETIKGQTARDVAETAAQGRIDAAGAKGGAFVMGPNGLPINTKPLGQLEQRAITSFAEAMPVLNELQSKLNPNENQFSSWMKNAATGAAYNMGFASDPAEQAKYQLSGLLSIIGSSPYVVGSRSFQMIKLAMAHLTSPLSSDAYKSQQIDEIKKLWPQMQQEILAAHMNPGDPSLTQTQPQEDPNDPSTWARKQ